MDFSASVRVFMDDLLVFVSVFYVGVSGANAALETTRTGSLGIRNRLSAACVCQNEQARKVPDAARAGGYRAEIGPSSGGSGGCLAVISQQPSLPAPMDSAENMLHWPRPKLQIFRSDLRTPLPLADQPC